MASMSVYMDRTNRTVMGLFRQFSKLHTPKRKLVFQPSIFRCYVSFREGNFVVFFLVGCRKTL